MRMPLRKQGLLTLQTFHQICKKNSQQLKSCQQNVSCFLIRIIADGNLKGEKMNYKYK